MIKYHMHQSQKCKEEVVLEKFQEPDYLEPKIPRAGISGSPELPRKMAKEKFKSGSDASQKISSEISSTRNFRVTPEDHLKID